MSYFFGWPGLPAVMTSLELAILFIAVAVLAEGRRGFSDFAFALIVLRGLAVAGAANIPDARAIMDFLNDDYVRLAWYVITIGLVLLETARQRVIEERFEKIMGKSKLTIEEIMLVLERYHRDNPGSVVVIPAGASILVLDKAVKEKHKEEEALGDTERGRTGPPLT